MRELIHQAEAAQIAAKDLNMALQRGVADIGRCFAAAQSLLASGAMVSKMLWPQPPSGEDEASRQSTLARGKTLRAELEIKSIPILQSRKVRNAFEHFDDRLDRYFDAGKRIVVDRNIGPRDRLVAIGDEPAQHLRLIDPEAGTVSVLDDEVSMQELFDSVSDVARRAAQWLAKHHM